VTKARKKTTSASSRSLGHGALKRFHGHLPWNKNLLRTSYL